MSLFPTPDQIREVVIGGQAVKSITAARADKNSPINGADLFSARCQLIGAALVARGKAFTFAQALLQAPGVEKTLLLETKNNGWSYDLVNDYRDGNYYIFRPLSKGRTEPKKRSSKCYLVD